MKFFTNKSIWTKIIIVLIFILVFEFVVSKPSLGAMDMLEFGGKLVSPIVSFVIALGDRSYGNCSFIDYGNIRSSAGSKFE